jgi:hypothetical protein
MSDSKEEDLSEEQEPCESVAGEVQQQASASSESASDSNWERLNDFHDQCQKAADANQIELDKSLFKYSGLIIGGLVLFAEKLSEKHVLASMSAGIWAVSLCSASIATSLLQYPIANMAIWKRNQYAEKYYIDSKKDALNKKSLWDRLLTAAAWVAGICLAGGLVFGIFFLTANLDRRNDTMDDKKEQKTLGNCAANDALPARMMHIKKPEVQTTPKSNPDSKVEQQPKSDKGDSKS